MQSNGPLIEIRDLTVDYWQQGAWASVVEDLKLQLAPAETFGLVGESGCGKSTTANALLGYCPRGARYRRGSVWFGGRDLLRLSNRELQRVRGRKISLVPQNPTTALSPAMRVGSQIVETLTVHGHCSDKQAKERTLELFRLVSLSHPDKTFAKYPHQLSGGQQQRVIIAMALACEPQLIVLDEPTTGLDVTTQAQILDLLADLRARYGLAMFYVTHNLGVVAQICHRIGVMYAGRLVEVAPRSELFMRPLNPYTQGLIASVPRVAAPSRRQSLLLKGILRRSELSAGCPFASRCEFAQERCLDEMPPLADVGPGHSVACWRWQEVPPLAERLANNRHSGGEQADAKGFQTSPTLLKVQDLNAGYLERHGTFSLRRFPKVVASGISLEIRTGETFALVGESGSGKTTVARALDGLLAYVSGRSEFEGGLDLTLPVDKRSRELLRSIQLVFQNPDASLNPRRRVGQIIGRPLEFFFGLSGPKLRQQVERLLADVQLDASHYSRFPDELSGGERQRVAIARALAAEPKLLLCDEILSALDVSVQANILELLIELQARRGIAFLFISHDLAVVRSLAHRVGVMYWGSLCEVGDVEEVFRPPYHPYTYLLLSAIPEADPDQVIPAVRRDAGLVTDDSKTACPFAQRCPMRARRTCQDAAPPWQQVSPTHSLCCHASLEELQQLDLWAERFCKQDNK